MTFPRTIFYKNDIEFNSKMGKIFGKNTRIGLFLYFYFKSYVLGSFLV